MKNIDSIQEINKKRTKMHHFLKNRDQTKTRKTRRQT